MTLSKGQMEVALFRLGYIAIAVIMLFPLLVVISTSVTPGGNLRFPPEGISLTWYHELLADQQWLSAFFSSLLIATGTMAISTVLGVMAAFGVQNISQRSKLILQPLILIPLLIPPVVLGVTLLMYLSRFNLQQTYIGVILAHTLYGAPFVFFIMQATLSRYDWSLQDATYDLGATPLRSFYEVIFPNIKSGIFAGALIAFILSLQEFIMALFLTGQDTVTVPVLAWTALRDLLSPLISVVSTLLILSVIIFLVPAALSFGYDRLAKQL